MRPQISEADWKVFKQLRELALERFSQEVRAQCIAKFNDSTLTAHERYLAVYDLIHDRDAEMARTFDTLRRSTALFQLRSFWTRGLLEEQDVQALSEETRRLAEMTGTA
jgi:hypothetical protein